MGGGFACNPQRASWKDSEEEAPLYTRPPDGRFGMGLN
jgi:hypothetical protein